MMAEATYLTVRQAAERMQLKEDTIRRWLRSGRLHGTYLSDRAGWRIPESEIRRILEDGEREG